MTAPVNRRSNLTWYEMTPILAEEIISTVCNFYDIKPVQLYKSKRGEFNEPRNIAIFLMRRLRKDSLKAIGAQLNIEKYNSVCSVIERLKNKNGKGVKVETEGCLFDRYCWQGSRADVSPLS